MVKGSNFIHESTIPFNVCEGIVDFYYNNDNYKTHEGSHSGGKKDFDIKESVDLSCNVDYGEFDSRIDQYFQHLDRQLKVYFNKFERSHMPCRVTDKFNIQWYPPGNFPMPPEDDDPMAYEWSEEEQGWVKNVRDPNEVWDLPNIN